MKRQLLLVIARKSALIITIQLANAFLAYIALKFVAVYMQKWEYGIVGFAYGFTAIFYIFGSLGFDFAHVKRVSEGKDLGTCIATFATIKIMLAGLMSFAVIASIAIWKYVIGRGFETPFHEKAVYIMLAYFALYTISQPMIATFNARKEIAKSRLPYFLFTFVRVIATIFVAFYKLGPLALAYTYLLGEIFYFAFSLYLFRTYPVGKPSFSFFKDYFSFAIHMAIAIFSWQLIANIDKVFIQLFWTAEQVGDYFAVYNLSRSMLFFAFSIGMLLMPTVSSYHAQNNLKEIRSLVYKSERYLSMLTMPVIALMIVLSHPIVKILLSNKYIEASPILQILPVFVLLEILSRPYQSQFEGMNMPQITRNRILIMMLSNVFLNAVLVPKNIKSLGLELAGLGAKGAAIATVISYIIGFAYLRMQAWRITKTGGNKCVVFHVISAIIMGITINYMLKYVAISVWYELLGIALIGIAIYFGILCIIREFKKEDLHLFLDTLNVKKMLKYIKEEMKGK